MSNTEEMRKVLKLIEDNTERVNIKEDGKFGSTTISGKACTFGDLEYMIKTILTIIRTNSDDPAKISMIKSMLSEHGIHIV